MTRRQALRLFGLAGGAALAAACTPAAPAAPTSAPTAPAKPAGAQGPAPTLAPAPIASPAAKPGTAASASPAASPAAKPAASPSPVVAAISDAAWQDVVAAARREGTVAVATYPGSAYRKIMDEFEKAYPGIKVEHTTFQSSSRDYVPRVLQERNAGLYLWDVATMPSTELLLQLRPVGAVDPIRPAIVRAEVLDNRAWQDGFDGGWLDKDKNLCYALTQNRNPAVWFDANQVNPAELKSIRDLLDPRWKGKMLGPDPRTRGAGFNPATAMRVKTKDDSLLEKLYKGQEVQLVDDARLQVEALVRGRSAVHLGAITQTILADFQTQGVGQNVKNTPVPDFDYINSSSSVMWLMNRAPHPNAAKVLINWLLTKEAGDLWAKGVGVNSRRADVPVFDPDLVPVPAQQLVKVDAEDMLDELTKTTDLAKKVLG